MTNLQLLLPIGLVIGAWAVWKHRAARYGRTELIAFAALCSFWLALALRFGARTYPGLHFSNSPLLNGLLNGSTVFTTIGYLAVATGSFRM
jgi:hypothetical protein